MSADTCHCFAVRQAGRWISQLYDQHLAPSGLRSTQFAVLSRLHRRAPMGIGELSQLMVMDRTTLTRAIAPLEREALLVQETAPEDRRRKTLALTDEGRKRLALARPLWRKAQAAFEEHFGAERAGLMREMLRDVPHA